MAPKALTRSEMADLARSLQTLLGAIHNDELSASTATTYRLEGALTALGGRSVVCRPTWNLVRQRGKPRLTRSV
jgi:hypothetical protein